MLFSSLLPLPVVVSENVGSGRRTIAVFIDAADLAAGAVEVGPPRALEEAVAEA